MQRALSTRTHIGASHVAAALSGATAALTVALASAEAGDVAFGVGCELALAFVDGKAVAPEWVQVFPKGPEIKARDGRRWTLDRPQDVLDAFTRNNADLPADINHATEILGPEGKEAPAYGWIKEFAIREGLVMARVEWTPEGAAYITGKKYRYVSPAFTHTKDGRIVGVKSLALVTHPALDMPALAHLQPTPPENTTMSLAARLIAVYGLAASATDDQIYDAATTNISLARDARDPAKLVPAADLTAALARATTAETALASIQEGDKEKAAVARVDTATAAGKISPDSREHWLSIARATPEAFDLAIASMQATIKPASKTAAKPVAGDDTDEHGLDAEQLSIARELGIEPAVYAAELKG